jgi:hypothetical protein
MVVIFNFLLWVLLTLLAWDHRQLRGTVKRLKARIDRLEQPPPLPGKPAGATTVMTTTVTGTNGYALSAAHLVPRRAVCSQQCRTIVCHLGAILRDYFASEPVAQEE